MKKINVSNTKAVSLKLIEAQGNSKVNLLDLTDVARLVNLAQHTLDECLPKKYQVGAVYNFCFPGPWSNAYDYSQGSSSIELTKGATVWFITKLERVKVWSKTPKISHLVLSEMQERIAADKLLRAHLKVDDELYDND